MSGPAGLEGFLGRWALQRRIDDRRAGATLHGEGTATLTGDRHEAIYDEALTLHMPGGATLAAERRYLWRAVGAGRIEVLFDDGRPFHVIELSAAHWQSGHDCAPDRYDVTYDFADWPDWRAVWEVAGPRKAYRLESRYCCAREMDLAAAENLRQTGAND